MILSQSQTNIYLEQGKWFAGPQLWVKPTRAQEG